MRDRVDAVARELQRSKTSKEQRITSNTVMRVAIRQFLDEFNLPQGGSVNSEEELLQALKRRKRQ